MAIVRNFAMTPEEFRRVTPPPPGCAWMSCHFSPTGITDLPEALPEGSLLILDDSISPEHIDPQQILGQLTDAISRLHCEALLLDLQKPRHEEIPSLISLLTKGLPCPVGVSQNYGIDSEGPVFLSLLPAHKSLKEHLEPWAGREIWLEVGPGPESARVTAEGTRFLAPRLPLPPCPHRHQELNCHYGIELKDQEILFTLYRTGEDLKDLTAQAEALGVTRTIGLYQELF